MIAQAGLVGVLLNQDQVSGLSQYLLELQSYNRHTNLVSCADPARVAGDHLSDSLTLVPVLRRLVGASSVVPLVDVGSGAGFPGLVLGIACQETKVVLVESIGKKVRFLQKVIDSLGLGHRVSAVNERSEAVAQQSRFRESFSVATARAVGSIEMVSELCLPLLKKGGIFLAQRSRRQERDEVERLARVLAPVGGLLTEVVIPEGLDKEHLILIIKKDGVTPRCYPRSPAQMKRSPLGT